MDIKFESTDRHGRSKEFEVSWEDDELCQYWGTVAYGKDKCCGHGSDNFLNMPSLKKHLIDDALTITCTLTVNQSDDDIDDDLDPDDDDDYVTHFVGYNTVFSF